MTLYHSDISQSRSHHRLQDRSFNTSFRSTQMTQHTGCIGGQLVRHWKGYKSEAAGRSYFFALIYWHKQILIFKLWLNFHSCEISYCISLANLSLIVWEVNETLLYFTWHSQFVPHSFCLRGSIPKILKYSVNVEVQSLKIPSHFLLDHIVLVSEKGSNYITG